MLELYFDTEIKTKRELRQSLDSCFSAVLTQAMAQIDSDTCAQWLQTLSGSQGSGSQLLRREAAKNPGTAQLSLLQACRGISQLERHNGGAVRLAVLSAQATSNPHALDNGTLCGKLFLYLLAFRAGRDFPGSAEAREELYYENGILCDSISSLVTQVGLVLQGGSGGTPCLPSISSRA